MVRVKNIVGVVSSLIVTAVTFGLIGQSTAAQSDISTASSARHLLSTSFHGTEVAMQHVLVRVRQHS